MKEHAFPLPEAPGADRYVGATFAGRYQIVRKLAEGAQARVYVARHALIGRSVAVKMLLPVLATDRALVERFLNEGRAAGTLGHPNIVDFLDMGVAPDGSPYLVMELLEGRSLAHEIYRAGPFEVGRAVYIATQIASAVALANQRGIVHRDLKPDNVFLTERAERPDHVKVLDFGISKIAGAAFVATSKGQFLGTPGFMAPEQLEDPGGVDQRADVYGLGATLYQMLAGAPPFVGVDFPRVLRSIAEESPRPLAEARDDLPPSLVDAVECAMSKSPGDRYQTMGEFERALSPYAVEPTRRASKPAPRPALSPPPLGPSSGVRSSAHMPVNPRPSTRAPASPRPSARASASPASAGRLPAPPRLSASWLAAAAAPADVGPLLAPADAYPDAAEIEREGLAAAAGVRAHWQGEPLAPARPQKSAPGKTYALGRALVVIALGSFFGLGIARFTSSASPEVSDAPRPAAAGPTGAALEAPPADVAPREAGAPPANAALRGASVSPPGASHHVAPKARTAAHPTSQLAAVHGAGPRPAAAAARPAAPPGDACNPPFYYEGTKKVFKPACL